MNRPELFDKTIQTLVKAYFDGTLTVGNCHACAVGNICGGKMDWAEVFMTYPQHINGRVVFVQDKSAYPFKGDIEVITSTGYTVDELARVEFAFESAVQPVLAESPSSWLFDNSPRAMFTRLMAVVDVLSEIHEADAPTSEAARLQFVKEPA